MNFTPFAGSNDATLPVPESEFRASRHERIAKRAFEIYEARGGDHGQDLADWLQAEQQIDTEVEDLDWDD
jgi:hypothetical protein